MTDVGELAETLRAIAEAFASLGVRWAVGGSLASAAYGEPRATNDIDVIAELDVARARAFAEALGASFYADADMAADAARRRASFNVIDERSFIKVDVFVPGPGALGTGQLDRRRSLELLEGAVVPVLGPEDVVLQKLRWYREGGAVSDRQWRDILAVIRAVSLDDDYLDAAAPEAELGELLARARRDAVDG